MKLTSLFHLSLITLAAGLTADLAAKPGQAAPQPKSASAQAEAKEARADQNAFGSKVQEPLTLKYRRENEDDSHYQRRNFEQKESLNILAHLFNTKNIEDLRKLTARYEPIEVPRAVDDAILIAFITENEQTAEKVEDIVINDESISLEGAIAWYTAYMQAVADGEITLGQDANLNGAVGACAVKLVEKNTKTEGDLAIIQLDSIIKFLLQDAKLNSIKITTEDGTCDAAQYMFMMTRKPDKFCPQYGALKKLKSIFEEKERKARYDMGNPAESLYYDYHSLLPRKSLFKILKPKEAEDLLTEEARAEACKAIEAYRKRWAEKSAKEKQSQAQSAAAVEQQPKVAPAPVAAESDHPQANPAPIMDAPAQPKNILTRAKDFTHRLARYGAYALVGAAAIYGGYRLYKHANIRKLARYAGNWA